MGQTVSKSLTVVALLSIFMGSINAQAIPPSENPTEKLNLTGTWIGKGSKFTLDQRGCISGYAGKLINNDQDPDQGIEITVIQMGNKLIIPDQVITYWGSYSASYKQHTQGTVSGNKVRLLTSATPSFGRFTMESLGTISDDGNTITGEILCKGSRGPATARVNFTWTKQIKQPQGATSSLY